jgi:hypothetical protein
MYRNVDNALIPSCQWVRSPWWDASWLLSGLPIGIAASILSAWIPPLWLLAAGVLIFQTAHSISPIALAWSHQGFREMMLARPVKFLALPLAILGICTLIGLVCGQYWAQPRFDPVTLKIAVASRWEPLWGLGLVYGLWNIYHFGKQDFGVMSIYRYKAGGYDRAQRSFDLIFCCLTGWAAMSIPIMHGLADYLRIGILGYRQVVVIYLLTAIGAATVMIRREWRRGRLCPPRIALIITNAVGMGTAAFWWCGGLGIISMNHWLTAIGLASHVKRQAVLFPILLVFLGTAVFCLLFVRGWRIPTHVAATAIGFRLGLSNVHFLYDRWVWKLSDPRVRATIAGIC